MNPEDIHILLVDDEPDILEILSFNLHREGYQIHTAKNGKQALKRAKKQPPHLVLLDMMMPKMNGIETCRKMRELPALKNTIICFLTALNNDQTEMNSYEAGADDYITKPVRPKVLVSKVKALLRRLNSSEKSEPFVDGELTIDFKAYLVEYEGEPLHLPRKEFELLKLLATQPGKVFSREVILAEIWGEEVVVGGRTVDVHIRKLREKIGSSRIETVTGIGYKYVLSC